MKNIKVMKIGGSVLRTSKDYLKVAKKIVENMDSDVCIVTSAMKGMTNKLASTFLEAIPEPDFWNFEKFVGMGEIYSAVLLDSAFKSLGKNSITILPWMKEWPLYISLKSKKPVSSNKTNEMREFQLLKKSKTRTKKYLPELFRTYEIIIIPGFVAKDNKGRFVTLGRGGSDISALLICELLGSEELVLIKDVEGIMSVDPKAKGKPERIKNLDSFELGMIASSGAEILNPISLKHREKLKRIRVVSFNAKSFQTGTEILFGEKISVKVSEVNFAVLTFVGTKMPETPGILYRISRILKRENVSIYSITISDNLISLYIKNEIADFVYRLLAPLLEKIRNLKVLNLKKDIGKVTIRSLKFINEPGIVKKIVSPISKEGINIWEVLTIHTDVMVFVDNSDLSKTYKVMKKIFSQKK